MYPIVLPGVALTPSVGAQVRVIARKTTTGCRRRIRIVNRFAQKGVASTSIALSQMSVCAKMDTRRIVGQSVCLIAAKHLVQRTSSA